MDRNEVKKYALQVLSEQSKSADRTKFFTQLYDSNLLDCGRVLKGCINHYYYKLYKDEGTSHKTRVLDCCIMFDVTNHLVEDCVYKHRNVVLNFNL